MLHSKAPNATDSRKNPFGLKSYLITAFWWVSGTTQENDMQTREIFASKNLHRSKSLFAAKLTKAKTLVHCNFVWKLQTKRYFQILYTYATILGCQSLLLQKTGNQVLFVVQLSGNEFFYSHFSCSTVFPRPKSLKPNY